jgi:hypothetical protein
MKSRKWKLTALALAGLVLLGATANATPEGFTSEGRYSCKASWDCFARSFEMAEQEAILKAEAICAPVHDTERVGPFEYEDCSYGNEVCFIARAEFRCFGW